MSYAKWPRDKHEFAPTQIAETIYEPLEAVDLECRPSRDVYKRQPIHYAIFLINALLIGSFMPPVGVLFYVTCGIAGANAETAMKQSFVYLSIVAAGMLLIGFVPSLVLWLPQLLGILH